MIQKKTDREMEGKTERDVGGRDRETDRRQKMRKEIHGSQKSNIDKVARVIKHRANRKSNHRKSQMAKM